MGSEKLPFILFKKVVANKIIFCYTMSHKRKEKNMFCVPNGNRIEFYDNDRNPLGVIDLYGSNVISAYVNESGMGSAICEDGSAYQISINEYGSTYYSQIY